MIANKIAWANRNEESLALIPPPMIEKDCIIGAASKVGSARFFILGAP